VELDQFSPADRILRRRFAIVVARLSEPGMQNAKFLFSYFRFSQSMVLS
jgi:hypothetical protein